MTVILRGIWSWRVPPPPPRRGAHNTRVLLYIDGLYLHKYTSGREKAGAREVKPAARVLLRARCDVATDGRTLQVCFRTIPRDAHTAVCGCPPFFFPFASLLVFFFSSFFFLSPSLFSSLLFVGTTAIGSSVSPICNLAYLLLRDRRARASATRARDPSAAPPRLRSRTRPRRELSLPATTPRVTRAYLRKAPPSALARRKDRRIIARR